MQKFPFCMPRNYADHALCKQLRVLLDEDLLQDTTIVFKPHGGTIRLSAFLLSLVSPVFHKMVCGAFKESVNRQLELEEVDEKLFKILVGLSCAQDDLELNDLGEVVELGRLADRFQMSEVVASLEDTVLQHLTVDVCAEVMAASSASGLVHLEEGCRILARQQFEEVAQTPGFVNMKEEMLSSLLDDDGLTAAGEEGVFEALVRWMNGGDEGCRGESLLTKIRFPLMDDKYLELQVAKAIPHSTLAAELVREARMIKELPFDQRGAIKLNCLSHKALVPRVEHDVAWDKYADGGERRLVVQADIVHALAECMGRVCSGSLDGRIRVWNKATLEEERTLQVENDAGVWSLTAWRSSLISGHEGGRVRVWDVALGRCERVLEGHTGDIYALAVCGERLVSGSYDRTIRVWALGAGAAAWPCERMLESRTSKWDLALAVWRGWVLSGSADRTIRVWAVATGAHEATLDGHTHAVHALVTHRRRLYSSSQDRTIRVWALGTWELLHTVEAYPPDSRHHALCLAVSGGKLVSGSSDGHCAGAEEMQCEMRVWDLARLECERTFRQPTGAEVWALLSVRGEVWASVGEELVVWGLR